MYNLPEKIKKILKNKGGYTIIELLVYMAIIAIVAVVIFDIIFFIYRINNRIVSVIQTNSGAYSAAERIIYEIQNAKYVYKPTSNFANYGYDATKSDQLSLVTSAGVSLPETTSYIDFYLENNTLFIKKDGVDPVALTASNLIVSDLSFNYYINDWRESIVIDLTIKPNNTLNSDSSIRLTSTATLRSSNN